MPNLPTWESYGPYSGNYGTHALRFIDAEGQSFWFSYRTLIAFRTNRTGLVVRQNGWGPTTGKHLNAIDGGAKKDRLSAAAFARVFEVTFGRAMGDAA